MRVSWREKWPSPTISADGPGGPFHEEVEEVKSSFLHRRESSSYTKLSWVSRKRIRKGSAGGRGCYQTDETIHNMPFPVTAGNGSGCPQAADAIRSGFLGRS